MTQGAGANTKITGPNYLLHTTSSQYSHFLGMVALLRARTVMHLRKISTQWSCVCASASCPVPFLQTTSCLSCLQQNVVQQRYPMVSGARYAVVQAVGAPDVIVGPEMSRREGVEQLPSVPSRKRLLQLSVETVEKAPDVLFRCFRYQLQGNVFLNRVIKHPGWGTAPVEGREAIRMCTPSGV